MPGPADRHGPGPGYRGPNPGGPPPGAAPKPSLFDRIPWSVVIPAGMQLANELREAVRDYSQTRTGPGPATQARPAPPPPPGATHAQPPHVDYGPQLHELHRRLDRLEAHHEELGRLIERLAVQETEQNRALQSLANRVVLMLAMSGMAAVLALVALVAALTGNG